MRLVVKQKDRTIDEFRFAKGPISIGRKSSNEIFLPDRTVSKQHAIISASDDGKWMVEDKGSANKTYLNGEPIHKAEIKTGDCLSITDFTIVINLEDSTDPVETVQPEDTIHLEATL